ncbi:YihY/virulence factor BrkB family protein [Diaphorobacter sp.]|uniref:YihY/virulence factor BrkB family protein n=1 Tax=Diaphorobacter sp. TaxID=1934310 RepID=UPI00258B64A7|nr:YihY/virulence factor BrkB family protein [Diaphorobacter sp.]
MPLSLQSLKSFAQPLLQRVLQPIAPLVRAVQMWLDADGLRMSAAMSFYGMLSLAPLLLLLVGVLGWWIDQAYLESNLISQVRGVMGERGAEVVRLALASAQEPAEGRLASVAGFVLLLSGATGVFVELQSALERLWAHGQPAPERKAWWRMASLRLRGLAYVLAIGFLLLVSLVLSTAINVLATWASARLPFGSGTLLQIVNEAVAFAVAVALFLGLMRIGSGPKPPTHCLVFGAVVGATLFTVGKQLLALYLSTAAVVSAYGAAGSLVVLLMWIYFSSAVLLFSAASARALHETRTAASAPAGR